MWGLNKRFLRLNLYPLLISDNFMILPSLSKIGIKVIAILIIKDNFLISTLKIFNGYNKLHILLLISWGDKKAHKRYVALIANKNLLVINNEFK